MASRKTKTLFGLSLTSAIFLLCVGSFCIGILIITPSSSTKYDQKSNPSVEPQKIESSKVAGISDEKKEEVKFEPTQIPEPQPIVEEQPIAQSIPTPQPEPMPVPLPAPTPIQVQASCLFSCSGPDKDCGDFSGHAQAQEFFNCCGFSATNDPMQLDGRGNKVDDGIACEN